MGRRRTNADVASRPWYLTDLDGEANIIDSFADKRRSQVHQPSVAAGVDDASCNNNVGGESDSKSSSSRPAPPPRKNDRPYLVDDEEIIFVPADHLSLSYQPQQSADDRSWLLAPSFSLSAFVALILTILASLQCYYWQNVRKQRASNLVASKNVGKPSVKNKESGGISSADASTRPSIGRSAERKKAKKRRQKERRKVKKEEQQQITITSERLSTITVKKEEDIAIPCTSTCTPPASPVVTNAVQRQQQAELHPATPKTPLEYKMHVESIASVVSATGLGEQQSLQIANEAVIRRLDYELSERNSIQKEMRRERIEETRREEDRVEANRRHEESLKAIKGEKGLVEKAIEARKRCTEAAFQIFPGGHFLVCISLALVSMFMCLNFSSVIKGIYTNEAKRTYIFAIRQVCGCLDDEGNYQAGSRFIDGSRHVSSYLQFAAGFCPSIMKAYLFAPLSGWIESTTCLASCLLKCVGLLSALGFTHRLLRLFHCHEVVHQAVNVFSISVTLLATLVQQSPSHLTSMAVLSDLIGPILVTNILIMNALCYLTLWYKAFDDKNLCRAKRENEVGLERTLLFLTWLPTLSRLLSTLAAVGAGVYWGMR